jgi:hypothetical protein
LLAAVFAVGAAIGAVVADVDALVRLMRCLLSELDAAGHADALEIPLLLGSNEVSADVELDQRPHIGDGVSKGGNTCKGVTRYGFSWCI